MLELSQQEGFVFYQKPQSDEIYFLSGSWKEVDLYKTSNIDGFIVSNANKSTTYFLEGVGEIISSSHHIKLDYAPYSIDVLDKKQYLKKATLFVEACTKDISKVILSRIKKHVSNDKQDIFNTYLKLCKEYNHSFNYLFNIPNKGAWMGATPEILIKGGNNKHTTVALAGSKHSKNIEWKPKELNEQQLVTDYISEKLTQSSIKFQFNKTPETTIAGNIAHLKTTFDIETEKSSIELADLLHPTPAVCGLPQKKAQEFILNNEGYDRQFYTGFLGLINRSDCNLYVNLRCMQLFKNEQWLYVGGGITTNSIPKDEWEETELKAQTLLNILD